MYTGIPLPDGVIAGVPADVVGVEYRKLAEIWRPSVDETDNYVCAGAL